MQSNHGNSLQPNVLLPVKASNRECNGKVMPLIYSTNCTYDHTVSIVQNTISCNVLGCLFINISLLAATIM